MARPHARRWFCRRLVPLTRSDFMRASRRHTPRGLACEIATVALIIMRRTPPNDTNPAIEALLLEGYRKMSPAQKLERVRRSTMPCRSLHSRTSDAGTRTPTSGSRHFASRRAARSGADGSRGSAGMSGRSVTDAVRAAPCRRRLARAFDALRIRTRRRLAGQLSPSDSWARRKTSISSPRSASPTWRRSRGTLPPSSTSIPR